MTSYAGNCGVMNSSTDNALTRGSEKLLGSLDMLGQELGEMRFMETYGRVVHVVGTIIRAVVPNATLGELCRLENRRSGQSLLAEVIGFSDDLALLTPLGSMNGISSETLVIPTGKSLKVPVGDGLLGRVIDGLGRPLDDPDRPLDTDQFYPVLADAPSPMSRQLIEKPLALGVKAIDAVLTCGEGQRMGIFAAAGVGKSTLLGMLATSADVDVTIIALIGERGREVREFLERELGEEGLKRSVVVVSTSDRPAVERIKCAYVATAVAEYFRDQGKRVLLLMDSVTRFARAQREIGLASGEPPTRRGFPPSVFADLPRLLERAGQGAIGSITGLYTVLVEGDDMSEPVADEVRSILDGHIVLSRKLASANHYPAIDVLESASRVMNVVVGSLHVNAANRLRELMSKYQDIELLVRIGEYKAGSDPVADEALRKIDSIRQLLRQGLHENVPMERTVEALLNI